jgi:charged multivesicular body protein 2A
MEWLFGRRKTPQEMLRQNQRALNKAMRDLDRERQHMEQQEKKVIADIKKMAKMGQMVCKLRIENSSVLLYVLCSKIW